MKAFYLFWNQSSRSSRIFVPVDDTGKTVKFSQQEGIINTGSKSANTANRPCEHFDADMTDIAVFDSLGMKFIPNIKPSSPWMYHRLNSNAGIEVTSFTAKTQHLIYEYIFGTERYEYNLSIIVGETQIYYLIRDFRFVNGKMVYSWIGTRTVDIKIGASRFPFVEEYTMDNAGIITQGLNRGTLPAAWTTVQPITLVKRDLLRSVAWRIGLGMAFPERLKTFGELSNEALDSFTGEVSNGIQYSAEMTKLGELTKPLRQILSGNVGIKTLSAAWLSYEYGARLSAQDTKAYVAMLSRSRYGKKPPKYGTCRSRTSLTQELNGYKIYTQRFFKTYYKTQDSFIIRSFDTLRKAGFLPSASIAWDMVPFSFIVDWFSPIGEALEAFDKKGIYESHEFIESVLTDKVTFSCAANRASPGLQGNITFRYYNRKVQSSGVKPSFRPDDIDFNIKKLVNGTAVSFQLWK